MPKFNLSDHAYVVQNLPAASYAAAAEAFTTGINTQGFDELFFVFDVGVIAGGGSVAIRVQESAVLASGYVDVLNPAIPATTFVATNTALPGILTGRIDLAKRLQYIRIGYTVAVAAAIFGIVGVLTNPKYMPESGRTLQGIAAALASGLAFEA